MSGLQVRTIALCLLLIIVDGYDVLAMAFAAPSIAEESSLSAVKLGLVLSIGLAGMAIGAFFLSPLGDRFGRRPAILLCLAIVTVGMGAATLATDFGTLVIARLVTGIGVGAMTSSGTALVYEYSSAKRRGLGMGIVAAGFPLGAIIGGSMSILLIGIHGWRSVFLVGTVASGAMFVLVYAFVPESLVYLLRSTRPESRRSADALMIRLGLMPLMTTQASAPTERIGTFAPFFPPHRTATVVLSGMFILIWTTFYFTVSWLPKLVTLSGQPQQTGLLAGIMVNVGGVIGGLLAGFAIARFGLLRVSRSLLVLMALSVACLGSTLGTAAILPVSAASGLVMYGVMACIYSILGGAFPSTHRATAIGFVQTFGRLGAALGPYLGGVLIGQGLSTPAVCALLALPTFASVWFVRRTLTTANDD